VARLLPARAVANVVTDLVDAWDETQSSAPPPNSRLLSRRNKRVRTTYVCELASQTTKGFGIESVRA
jgi:hypothetical protein